MCTYEVLQLQLTTSLRHCVACFTLFPVTYFLPLLVCACVCMCGGDSSFCLCEYECFVGAWCSRLYLVYVNWSSGKWLTIVWMYRNTPTGTCSFDLSHFVILLCCLIESVFRASVVITLVQIFRKESSIRSKCYKYQATSHRRSDQTERPQEKQPLVLHRKTLYCSFLSYQKLTPTHSDTYTFSFSVLLPLFESMLPVQDHHILSHIWYQHPFLSLTVAARIWIFSHLRVGLEGTYLQF